MKATNKNTVFTTKIFGIYPVIYKIQIRIWADSSVQKVPSKLFLRKKKLKQKRALNRINRPTKTARSTRSALCI